MSEHNFPTAEIHLRDSKDGYHVTIRLSDGRESESPLPSVSLLPWASAANAVDAGRRLFDALFADPALREAWGAMRSGCRVRLWLDTQTPELHCLPWELLHDGRAFLAAGDDTPFSRYLSVDQPLPPDLPARTGIRVLAAIANPADLHTYGLAPLDVPAERARLEALWRGLPIAPAFLEPPVTPERLEAALREQRPHLLHILAHGAFNQRRDQAALYLQDTAGHTCVVADADFAGIFARLGQDRPRVVFLAACESAVRSTVDAFTGLAPKLVQSGVPAVVAMQERVAMSAAQALTPAFYTELFRHGEVDRALNAARSLLLTGQSPDAGVPVLLMRLKDGRLWAADAELPSPAAPQGAVYNITIQNASRFAIGDRAQVVQGAAALPPANVAPAPTVSSLRASLQLLDDVQIETLCLDHFPTVYEQFSRGMRRDEKINLLLNYVRRRPAEAVRLAELLM